MPRADSKHSASQYYSAPFPPSSSQYLQDDPPSPPPAQSQSNSSTQSSTPAQKKKHVCSVCDRPFSTSGHLARHSRVHTGERNHKCPFPGCETRCSRQDNLQQHYRIHLSPGSRRSSTRSAISRAMNNSATSKRASASSPAVDPPLSPPPLSSPPALEPARVYSHHSSPPNSPPPLTQATLPAGTHLPSTSSSRSSSSPEAYSSNHTLVNISSQSQSSQSYSYRSNTSTYQDQAQGNGYATYVHNPNTNSNSFSSYSNTHGSFNAHSLPQINTSSPIVNSQHSHDSPNPTPISSRHSISHISHPQSYSQNQPSAEPPSPASSHSHTSGPATPSYVYHDDTHSYQSNGSIVNDQPSISNGHIGHNHGYSSSVGVAGHQRFDSPPPTLAPIQEHRYSRRDDRSSDSHSSNSYLHNGHSMSGDYQYHHQSMAINHGPWKSDSGIRKGVGALVQ